MKALFLGLTLSFKWHYFAKTADRQTDMTMWQLWQKQPQCQTRLLRKSGKMAVLLSKRICVSRRQPYIPPCHISKQIWQPFSTLAHACHPWSQCQLVDMGVIWWSLSRSNLEVCHTPEYGRNISNSIRFGLQEVSGWGLYVEKKKNCTVHFL